MKITKEAQAQARRLIRLCMGADGRLQEDNVRRVATTLCTEKPRNYLAILKSFTDMVRLEVQRHTATVTTARPVQKAEKAAIRAKLDARHPGLRYEWLTDPSLIAGMTVKVGDNVTDASVRSRIERLEKLIS
ncbi:MAG: F0F1 ATP synthase subunit delta [Akkermansia sp.]|nr:F0F1 ATP synthase subunit delta [Akkermansia sp.]